MRKIAATGLLAAGMVMAGMMAAPTAEADGWRRGWGGPAWGYAPPPRYYYNRGYNNGAAVAGIVGLGVGAVIGSALAAPPPVYYAPPPPRVIYAPPPPVFYQPPPVVYQPPPRWVQPAPGWSPGWAPPPPKPWGW